MSHRRLQSGCAATPATHPDEHRPHVCGRCRNPWTVGNPNCPNAKGEQR